MKIPSSAEETVTTAASTLIFLAVASLAVASCNSSLSSSWAFENET